MAGPSWTSTINKIKELNQEILNEFEKIGIKIEMNINWDKCNQIFK